jgi:hypothetical protein
MSTNGYWEDISNLKFFTIIIVLLVFLFMITKLATINSTLWIVVTSLGVPFLIYIRIWLKHKTCAKAAVYFIFVPLNLVIIFYFLHQWTTFSMYFLALIEYFVALALVMSLAALFYE